MAIEQKYVSDPLNHALALSLDKEIDIASDAGSKKAAASAPNLSSILPRQQPERVATATAPAAAVTPPPSNVLSASRAASKPTLKSYADIHGTTQIQHPTPIDQICVGGHYLLEFNAAPLVCVNPDYFIWKVIGVTGTRVLAVPAYSFQSGKFLDAEFPKVGSFVATDRRDINGSIYEKTLFFDANGTMAAIEQQAQASGTPREKILVT